MMVNKIIHILLFSVFFTNVVLSINQPIIALAQKPRTTKVSTAICVADAQKELKTYQKACIKLGNTAISTSNNELYDSELKAEYSKLIPDLNTIKAINERKRAHSLILTGNINSSLTLRAAIRSIEKIRVNINKLKNRKSKFHCGRKGESKQKISIKTEENTIVKEWNKLIPNETKLRGMMKDIQKLRRRRKNARRRRRTRITPPKNTKDAKIKIVTSRHSIRKIQERRSSFRCLRPKRWAKKNYAQKVIDCLERGNLIADKWSKQCGINIIYG